MRRAKDKHFRLPGQRAAVPVRREKRSPERLLLFCGLKLTDHGLHGVCKVLYRHLFGDVHRQKQMAGIAAVTGNLIPGVDVMGQGSTGQNTGHAFNHDGKSVALQLAEIPSPSLTLARTQPPDCCSTVKGVLGRIPPDCRQRM